MSVLFYEATVTSFPVIPRPFSASRQPWSHDKPEQGLQMADGGAHMVKMADVEETKSEAADLLHSDDVKKDSHGKMDNADVGNDHHVVSIHKLLKM